MIKRLALAIALAASPAPHAAAQQQPFWAGADSLKCTIETASTCDGASCVPLPVMRVVLVDLAAKRICASRDGAACNARHYEIVDGEQWGGGRLLLVVKSTGTSYSIGADGTMSGASVVAPKAHVFLGRCEIGGS